MSVPASHLYESVAPHVNDSGTCDEKLYLRSLNQALALLWPMGDWEGSIVRCALETNGECCVMLPWQIEQIRQAWFGNCPVPTMDKLYEALTPSPLSSCSDCECAKVTNLGIQRPVPQEPDAPYWLAVDFRDNPVGTKIEVVYWDSNNQSRVFRAEKTEDCENPLIVLDEPVYKIIAINKGETSGMIGLNSSTDKHTWTPFAAFHPQQVNPTYSLVRVSGAKPGQTIFVRAKLRVPRITSMSSPVPIENAAALSWAVRAVAKLGRDGEGYRAALNEAVGLLKLDELDQMDPTGIPVIVHIDRVRNLTPNR